MSGHVQLSRVLHDHLAGAGDQGSWDGAGSGRASCTYGSMTAASKAGLHMNTYIPTRSMEAIGSAASALRSLFVPTLRTACLPRAADAAGGWAGGAAHVAGAPERPIALACCPCRRAGPAASTARQWWQSCVLGCRAQSRRTLHRCRVGDGGHHDHPVPSSQGLGVCGVCMVRRLGGPMPSMQQQQGRWRARLHVMS